MIENMPDDELRLSFEDWTPNMTWLLAALYRRPHRPGFTPDFEIGIDTIYRMPDGPWRIELLCDQVEYFRVCPTQSELIKTASVLFESDADMRRVMAWQTPDTVNYPIRKLHYRRPPPRSRVRQ